MTIAARYLAHLNEMGEIAEVAPQRKEDSDYYKRQAEKSRSQALHKGGDEKEFLRGMPHNDPHSGSIDASNLTPLQLPAGQRSTPLHVFPHSSVRARPEPGDRKHTTINMPHQKISFSDFAKMSHGSQHATSSGMPSAPSPNQQRHSTLWNRDLSQDPEHTAHVPHQNVSFNDFKNMPKSPPSSHQAPPPQPGAAPTYDYSRQGPTPAMQRAQGAALGAVRGVGAFGAWGGRKFIVSPWQRRAELRRNLKATAKSVSGRLGPPPKRILKDIVQLKKQYPEYKDDIDREVKAHNVHLQDWSYGHQQAFKTQAKTIAKRYHDVGKVMARQQGRSAAWRILKSVPGVARQEYNRIKNKAEIEARNIRDQELQARAGNIQQHAREVDYHYDQHMDQVTRDLEKGVLQAKAHGHAEQQAAIQAQAQAYAQSQAARASHESLLFIEGKARDFREVMRNKRKTHARHVRSIDRGTMRYSYELKKRGRKSKERNPYDSPSWWGKDIGRETTLDQRRSRKRSVLRKKMKAAAYAAYSPYEADGPYGMREEYAGNHPVLHTAGKTISLPVTVPYHVARVAAKVTGLDELPRALKDMYVANKRGFVHNFLLR